jgi:hypothetical protein
MRITISVTKNEYETIAKVYEAMGQEAIARQILRDKTCGDVLNGTVLSVNIQRYDEHVIVTYNVNPNYSADVMNILVNNGALVRSIVATVTQVVELSKFLVSSVKAQFEAVNQKYLGESKKTA